MGQVVILDLWTLGKFPEVLGMARLIFADMAGGVRYGADGSWAYSISFGNAVEVVPKKGRPFVSSKNPQKICQIIDDKYTNLNYNKTLVKITAHLFYKSERIIKVHQSAYANILSAIKQKSTLPVNIILIPHTPHRPKP